MCLHQRWPKTHVAVLGLLTQQVYWRLSHEKLCQLRVSNMVQESHAGPGPQLCKETTEAECRSVGIHGAVGVADGGWGSVEECEYGLSELLTNSESLQWESFLLWRKEPRERNLQGLVWSKAKLVLRKLDICKSLSLRDTLDDTTRVLDSVPNHLDFHSRTNTLLESPKGSKSGIGDTGTLEEGARGGRGCSRGGVNMDSCGVFH